MKDRKIKTVIKIEDIGMGKRITGGGHNLPPSLLWVAKIGGFSDKYKYKRTFLKHNALDLTESNSVMTRGVYRYFWLDDNNLYEISSRISWNRVDRYFCISKNGEIIKLTEEQAETWIYDHLV